MEYTYTREDFDTPAPYEYICSIESPFERNIEEMKLAEYAKEKGFTTFITRYRKYEKTIQQVAAQSFETNLANFEHSKIELYTGGWIADDSGVYRYINGNIRDVACSHPIQPIERLRNIDTGELKIRLQWRRGNEEGRKIWSEKIVDLGIISNAKNIIELAKINISVSSGKRAQNLVDYLTDTIDYNYDRIPERKSVSRLGWNEEGFSPYIGNIVYDGDDKFARMFDAISKKGSFKKWIVGACEARAYSLTARIIIATSFASVLIEPMMRQPFILHLWSGGSGSGKTVAQMIAAAVWGEPSVGGDYFKTFNASDVGVEVTAGFLNSLPVIMDELQLAKDKHGKSLINVYKLAAGSGKTRSNTRLGLAATPRWANCFITGGESPITNEQDGAGALNRVIEIECLEENKVIENGIKTAEIMKLNYGHAGKYFVEKLCEDGVIDKAKRRCSELYEIFVSRKTTEKQAHAATMITLADELATEWIFKDGKQVTVDELSAFLKSKEAISAGERGYSFICDWVAQNINNFSSENENIKIYGRFPNPSEEDTRDEWVYIIRSSFNEACAGAGINDKALLSFLKTSGRIQTKEKGNSITKRIGKTVANCVVLKLKKADYYSSHESKDDFI